MPLQVSLGNFYGADSAIDFLIVLVSLLVSYQSYKVYKILKKRNYQLFSWSFLCISLAYFFKIISNLTIVYRVVISNQNFIRVILFELDKMKYINFVSFTFYKIFLLMGILILFLIMNKTYKRGEVIIFGYLSLTAILLTIYHDFIFHLTIVMLLISIVAYFHNNYKKNNSRQSLISYVAFVFILGGKFVDIFNGFHKFIYLLGEILIFIGFLTLLLNHIRTKNEKKNKT